MNRFQATRIANTYVPGLVAAYERGDVDGANQLYQMMTSELTAAGVPRHRVDNILVWAMTSMAAAMLRRVCASEGADPADTVALLTLRQHLYAAEG